MSRFVALAIVAAAGSPAIGCPMCKDGVTLNASPTTAPAEAASFDVNGSIYVMLGTLAVVGTAVGRAMVKGVRG